MYVHVHTCRSKRILMQIIIISNQKKSIQNTYSRAPKFRLAWISNSYNKSSLQMLQISDSVQNPDKNCKVSWKLVALAQTVLGKNCHASKTAKRSKLASSFRTVLVFEYQSRFGRNLDLDHSDFSFLPYLASVAICMITDYSECLNTERLKTELR